MKYYHEVLDWLYVQVPNYQRQGGPAYKPGLDNVKELLQDIGNPQELFESIHIAGTNGKGSVAHMLAAIYQENGYKVGVFTSPHISDFRERIKINGKMVSKEFVTEFIQEHQKLFVSLSATFFEICTAMAFRAFSDNKVDIAIVETGMGGRLDSTNVLKPRLAIITNIGLDHTKYLGDTELDIATEKAGIIKENIPVLIGEKQPEISKVFEKIAHEKNAPLYYSKFRPVETDLKGEFQKRNACTALTAVELLQQKWETSTDKNLAALHHVTALSGFKGRLQLVQKNPGVLIDVAHNPAGVQNLLHELKSFEYDHLHIVYGVSNDKDVVGIMNMLPKDATYYFTEFDGERSLKSSEFEKYGQMFDLNFTVYDSPKEALNKAQYHATRQDMIAVFGSFFILTDLDIEELNV